MIELKGEYTNAKIFAGTIEDGVYQQVYDIINCKAFKDQQVVCMPDVHVGAAGPCGLVATIGDFICPEHVGVDIGCTVSMMVLNKRVPEEKYADFEHKIKQTVKFGQDLQENVVFDERDFRRFLTSGFNRYRQKWPEMLGELPDTVTEEWITKQLRRIGVNEKVFYKSLGTIGSGNHFIEYDESEDGNICGVTLHFGSRNFGVKVCAYWTKVAAKPITNWENKDLIKSFRKEFVESGRDLKDFGPALKKYLEEENAKKHINRYLEGENLKGYLQDMCFAQLYALYNHKVVQNLISDILKKYGIKVDRVITSIHNFIDLEDHVLRKSAIRSYKGEEMLVPFNMRDGIAICEGKSNPEWLNSCSHGAGRAMSRRKAKENIKLGDFKRSMKGVYSTTICEGTIDESPMAYKETGEIINLIQETCDIKCVLKSKINIKSVKGEGE